MTDCIFCKIARGDIPVPFLFADDDVVAFYDLSPQAPTHVLVIPRQHIVSLAQSAPEHDVLLGKVLAALRQVAQQLGVDTSGYRTVLNSGMDGGQSVMHLHAHLLAGRTMQWPPG